MEVILGKMAGFCPGITYAVKKAEEILNNETDIVYCLGELTHNRQVMDKLEKKGLVVIDDINQAPDNSKVIIRAHGVPKKIYDIAKRKNIDLCDLTCRKVIDIHNKVLKNANDFIFIIGEKEHPEIIGTKGFATNNSSIIWDVDDIDDAILKFKESKAKKIYVVSQTTFSMEKFDFLVKEIKNAVDKDVKLKIDKTICNATRLRQNETIKISKMVDYMIIIGGKNSSNTRKLYEISLNNCKNVIHIQTKNDIEDIDFSKFNKIGVMAGASTPEESIKDVIEYVKEGTKNEYSK